MFKVGRILGEIANIKFPSSDFFNKNLEADKSVTSEDFVDFCFEYLENNKVKATFYGVMLTLIIQTTLHFSNYQD